MTSGKSELFALIRETLGDDAEPLIQKIRHHFGGDKVYIPTLDNGDRERGIKMLKQGMSVDDVATRLGYHRTTVWRWWRGRRLIQQSTFASREWEL